MNTLFTRRNFFKTSLGALSTLAAARTLAQMCGVNTGKQPLGPFFPNAGTPIDPIREDANPALPLHLASDHDLTLVKGRNGKATGQVVYVVGQVTDQNCKPVPKATIVIWQASHTGRYNHKGDSDNEDFRHPKTGEVIKRSLDSSFQSWGRAVSDENGNYKFKTIIPGFYPADLQGGWYRPPHVHFMVTATGYPQLVTQMYFSGENILNNDWIQELNQKDYLLQDTSITDEQRKKLVVEFKEHPNNPDGLVGRFDITLKR